MPRRKGLTDKQIDSLPRQTKRTIIADPELRGLYLRIPPADTNAPITYTVVARDPHGRQIWTAVGTTSGARQSPGNTRAYQSRAATYRAAEAGAG
jgi:hypothetical protein